MSESRSDAKARALIARIRKNWNDVAAIRALADLYTKAGDYPSLANLMEGWGDALQDSRAAGEAYVAAADALLMAGRATSEARLLFERALSRDAANVQALDRLTRLLEDARDFERLKQVLKYVAYQLEQAEAEPNATAADSSGSRQRLASVHYRLGQVYETHFAEPRKAATLYRLAIEENPRLITAIVAARRLYEESGNHKAVSKLYEYEIEATPNAEDKHTLLLALARHQREQCDDLDAAVVAFRRANKLNPSSLRALVGLAEALLARSERAPAGSAAALADRQRASEVFVHLAQSVGPEDALQYVQRALLLVPDHPRARALQEDLARGRGERPTGAAAWQPSAASGGPAEAWFQSSDAEPVTELNTGDLVPIEPAGRARAAPDSGGSNPLAGASLPPSVPPATLSAGAAAAAAAPAVPAGPAAAATLRYAPPAVRSQPPPPRAAHRKILNALPDDPSRVALNVNIGSATDSNFYVDASDSLIDGGVYVATYDPLPLGTRASLVITLPGRSVARAHGRVTLTRDLMDAFSDHIPGMCVEFEAVDHTSMQLIERFARKRAPMYVEP